MRHMSLSNWASKWHSLP